MELFSEVKNRYFQLLFRIINECAGGMAKSDSIRIIDEGEFEQKVMGKNQKSFADLVLNRCSGEEILNLLKEKDGRFYPSVENSGKLPLPVRLTNLEKAWLKALLEKDEINLVLGQETLDKLRIELDDFDTPVREEYFEMTNSIKLPGIVDRAAYERNFRLLLEALVQEKPIRYTNTDRNGNIYINKLALPVNIEYSMRDARFRISMYSIDDNRPIMANIFSLSDIRIVDEDMGMNREKAKKLLFEQKYSEEPVIMEVTDKKTAMERCFMCFSGMERTARDMGGGKYEIRLNYYLFEEENLIRNIISLGPYVKVISPQRIVDEILTRVKKSLGMY
jgi:hypothetical protein